MFVGKRIKKFLSLFNIETCYTRGSLPRRGVRRSRRYHIIIIFLPPPYPVCIFVVYNKKICVMPTEFFGASSLKGAGRTNSAHTSQPVVHDRTDPTDMNIDIIYVRWSRSLSRTRAPTTFTGAVATRNTLTHLYTSRFIMKKIDDNISTGWG